MLFVSNRERVPRRQVLSPLSTLTRPVMTHEQHDSVISAAAAAVVATLGYCLSLCIGPSTRKCSCERNRTVYAREDVLCWKKDWRRNDQRKLIFFVESTCDCCSNSAALSYGGGLTQIITPLRNSFFRKLYERTRAQEIRMPGSRETNFSRRGYHIPCVVFLSLVGDMD